ncbi:FKBP-type peptidyl-prolyl cis-trans isomerase [Actinomadura kijaniata]|uniref:Peptidyl-prolyl cis-trans isomerase n=1 Tax=Actinomadura namibiensis TaxID=182080 RepID=A0A7W3QQ90_ACTNM|nr:FKBP-type peptidyl-prolyl cis-trans isomerase [Actinomadura namibiensis]MBA8955407.1 peptidylprolyl isomerase [Actinomadura namibiensis]
MRRRSAPFRSVVLPLVAVVAAPLALSACSGSGDVQVEVKGAAGTKPEVVIPKGDEPGKELALKALAEGRGAQARKGDMVIADYVGYRWAKGSSKLLASSYVDGKPGAFPTGQLIPGLDKALAGRKAGARVVARIPPKDGYGENGNPQQQVSAGDTLVYVLDVRAVYPKDAAAQGAPQPLDDSRLPKVAGAQVPQVSVPKVAPPRTLQVRTLVRGNGPAVQKGQLLALQYAGVFWRNGQVFNSSWQVGNPYATTIGTGQVIKGWDQALVGQKVGSRMLLVVPPSLGYGAKGLPQAGIKGDDTLVFVVDLLGVH